MWRAAGKTPMAETRTARAERVLERLDLRLGTDGLSEVAVGRTLVYAELPDWIGTDDVRGALADAVESADFPGVVHEVPTFGVTVLVFDAGVVACPDATDRDAAAAALAATASRLADASVEVSDLRLRAVSLTAGPDGEWTPGRDGIDARGTRETDATGEDAHEGGDDGDEGGNGDAHRGRGDGDDDHRRRGEGSTVAAGVGVTPAPCEGCGRVPDGWEQYCPRCGADLKPETCGACGASLARWMLYCPGCGADATGRN
jgi:hypothetical protein